MVPEFKKIPTPWSRRVKFFLNEKFPIITFTGLMVGVACVWPRPNIMPPPKVSADNTNVFEGVKLPSASMPNQRK